MCFIEYRKKGNAGDREPSPVSLPGIIEKAKKIVPNIKEILFDNYYAFSSFRIKLTIPPETISGGKYFGFATGGIIRKESFGDKGTNSFSPWLDKSD